MKKNRNAFFSEANMQTSGFIPQPNMNMVPNMAPYSAASQSSSFYSGPANFNMNQGYNNNQISSNTDYDSRLSRLERQINRLETRVNKLENTSNVTYNIDETEINPNSNMYMI